MVVALATCAESAISAKSQIDLANGEDPRLVAPRGLQAGHIWVFHLGKQSQRLPRPASTALSAMTLSVSSGERTASNLF